MDGAHLLGVQRVDGGDQGLCPLQPPADGVVDGKAISDASIMLAFRLPLLDIV
jgi:hypothetical protein